MSEPCMGGWCHKRGPCPHSDPVEGIDPVQRLCLPGRDGHRLVESTRFRAVIVDVFTGREIEEVAA